MNDRQRVIGSGKKDVASCVVEETEKRPEKPHQIINGGKNRSHM